jgi:hypothetical protein
MIKHNFICTVCNRTFAEDEAERKPETTSYEFWGSKGTIKTCLFICPYCSSEEIDEFFGDLDETNT